MRLEVTVIGYVSRDGGVSIDEITAEGDMPGETIEDQELASAAMAKLLAAASAKFTCAITSPHNQAVAMASAITQMQQTFTEPI